MKKLIVPLLFSCLSTLFIAPLSNAADSPLAVTQATSREPVDDDRIAALWVGSLDENTSRNRGNRLCTVSFLGDNVWITARHCADDAEGSPAYLEQSDGEQAEVIRTDLVPNNADIALVTTGPGIDARPFELPTRSLNTGDTANLTGYGLTNDFASTAVVRITERLESKKLGSSTFKDLLESESITPSRSCDGDSGAPVYVGNVIYAVHSAGGFNPSCLDGINRKMWHSDVFPQVEWIKSRLSHDGSSDSVVNDLSSSFPLRSSFK